MHAESTPCGPQQALRTLGQRGPVAEKLASADQQRSLLLGAFLLHQVSVHLFYLQHLPAVQGLYGDMPRGMR